MKYLILFLFTSIAIAQDNIIVYYDFSVSEKLINGFPDFGDLESESETLDLQLHILDKKSVFLNANQTKSNGMAATFARAAVDLFYNTETNLFTYYNYDTYFIEANKYIIEDLGKVDWHITSEEKKIMYFTAIKAISKKDKNVIAWFIPELPYPFGPDRFNNLPGLIAELQSFQGYYTMKKISFGNAKKFTIPTQGQKITADEFSKLLKDVEDEYKTNYKQ